MIYKYNVACSNKAIEKSFDKIKQKIEHIRGDGEQDITSSAVNTIFVSEKQESFNLNTFILCGKLKALYAICAIRTDENYIHQWLILKDPLLSGHKKIYLNKNQTANTNLYRRMTVTEIKRYFNDEYDV